MNDTEKLEAILDQIWSCMRILKTVETKSAGFHYTHHDCLVGLQVARARAKKMIKMIREGDTSREDTGGD